jgi:hypothetical protein
VTPSSSGCAARDRAPGLVHTGEVEMIDGKIGGMAVTVGLGASAGMLRIDKS